MFSYHHAFHAGNHADVLKHITLLATLRHLMHKPGPLLLVDTHAGAGLYRLDSPAGQTSGEAQAGVLRLQDLRDSQEASADALQDYLEQIALLNPDCRPGQAWRAYPGSPWLMRALMNQAGRAAAGDRLQLFELHPSDGQVLEQNVAQLQAGRQIRVERQDGFAGLRALLPPPARQGGSRRALVLMDPSYELKTDYDSVATSIEDALRRFATGVYLVWYPELDRSASRRLPQRLQRLAQQTGRGWLHARLHVGQQAGERGLVASGMLVVNPPYTLAPTLKQALPLVLAQLRKPSGRHAGWSVEVSP